MLLSGRFGGHSTPLFLECTEYNLVNYLRDYLGYLNFHASTSRTVPVV